SSYSTPSSSPVAFLIARSITSLVMLTDRPLSIAARRRGLAPGSPPPALAATEISRMILVKILPRRASTAFLRASIEGPLPMESAWIAGSHGFYAIPSVRRDRHAMRPPGRRFAVRLSKRGRHDHGLRQHCR